MRRGAHSKSAPRLELPSRGGWNDGGDIPGKPRNTLGSDESVVTSVRTPSSRVLPIPSTGPNRSGRRTPRATEPATPLIVGGLGPPRAVLAWRAGLTAGA